MYEMYDLTERGYLSSSPQRCSKNALKVMKYRERTFSTLQPTFPFETNVKYFFSYYIYIKCQPT